MHDRNGSPIKVGDVVYIEAKVIETYATEDYCNAQVRVGFEKEHGPDNVVSSLTVNTRQLLLLKRNRES